MTAFACLALAIIFSTYSNLVIKAEATRAAGGKSVFDFVATIAARPLFWSAVFAFALGTLTWIVALRRLPLVVAQPTMALVFVTVPLAAGFVFGEPLPPTRIAGLCLIMMGVALVVGA